MDVPYQANQSEVNNEIINNKFVTPFTLGTWWNQKPVPNIVQTALNTKQNTITTGTINQYFRGDLSLANFPTLISQFSNDSGYITSNALIPYLTSATASTTYQPLDGNLTAISALNTNGLVRRTGANIWTIDNNTYITGAAGANTQIQFNNAGAFGASSNLTYDNSIQELTLSSNNSNLLRVEGTGTFELGKTLTVGALNLSPNKDFNSNITPWTANIAIQTSTVSWNSGLSGDGSNGFMRYASIFNAGFERWGASVALSANTTYNIRFWYRNSTNTPMRLLICQSMGINAGTGADLINAQNTTIPNSNGNWLYFNQNITTNSGVSNVIGFQKLNQTQGGGNFDVDVIEIFNSNNSYSPTLLYNHTTEKLVNRADNEFGNDSEKSVIINQPSTSNNNLIINAKSGQTSNLTEWRNSSGVAVTTIGGNASINAGSQLYVGNSSSFSSRFNQLGVGNVNHTIKAIASQTADLTQWQNSGGSVIARVTNIGDIFGNNLSGINTGDNAVNSLYSGLVTNANHTGDVVGATILTISDGAVTFNKQANINTNRLLGRGSVGSGIIEEIQLGTNLSLTGNTLNASSSLPIVNTLTTSTTVSINGIERTYIADLSSSITTTLPTATGNAGYKFIFKRIDTTNNTWTIDANSSELIDDNLTINIINLDSITIQSNGTNWIII